jgi:hypothetical protein
MNNMPYKPVDAFYYTELTEFDRLVMPHVPGVQAPLYELQREETIREFCRRSGALIGQHHPITVFADTAEYPLDGVPQVMDILTIKEMRYYENGDPVNEKAYMLDQDRATFQLQSDWPNGLTDKVIVPILSLTMCRQAERIEANFFDRWSDGIAAGIVRDLMIVPGKQWTNPQAAPLYDHKYESAISNAKIAVSKAFGKYALRTLPGHFE